MLFFNKYKRSKSNYKTGRKQKKKTQSQIKKKSPNQQLTQLDNSTTR